VQCFEFCLCAEEARAGLVVNGSVQVFEGPLLRGEVPISIFVRTSRQPTPDLSLDRFVAVRGAAHCNTFPSYSRQDDLMVRAVEAVAESVGDRFLRDVRVLRAGEEWAPALLGHIDRAPHCASPLGAILDYRRESRNNGGIELLGSSGDGGACLRWVRRHGCCSAAMCWTLVSCYCSRDLPFSLALD
jgi:hypothetical protein